MIASRLNFPSVPSIPRVRPRSWSAASAARYAASTVVFTDARNLHAVSDLMWICDEESEEAYSC